MAKIRSDASSKRNRKSSFHQEYQPEIDPDRRGGGSQHPSNFQEEIQDYTGNDTCMRTPLTSKISDHPPADTYFTDYVLKNQLCNRPYIGPMLQLMNHLALV